MVAYAMGNGDCWKIEKTILHLNIIRDNREVVREAVTNIDSIVIQGVPRQGVGVNGPQELSVWTLILQGDGILPLLKGKLA